MRAKHFALSYACDVLRVFPHTGERRDPPFRGKRSGYLTTDGQAPGGAVCKGKREAPEEEDVE
jgi:hypothetical protein